MPIALCLPRRRHRNLGAAFLALALAGAMAYFGSFNGKLYAVDLATGAYAWEFQTEAGRKDALGVLGPDEKQSDLTCPFKSAPR